MNNQTATRIFEPRPRQSAIEVAQFFLDQGWETHFTFTCSVCGEHCTLVEANTLPANGECSSCGSVQPLDIIGVVVTLPVQIQT